jgi:predicted RNase H-like nuclease (RuvC/YqgF family)
MNWVEITGLVLTFVAGGGIVSVVTIGGKRKKAEAEAKQNELENVQEAIKIWRETAENLTKELKAAIDKNARLSEELEKMHEHISELKKTNDKILVWLSMLDCENCDRVCESIEKLNIG